VIVNGLHAKICKSTAVASFEILQLRRHNRREADQNSTASSAEHEVLRIQLQ
jgi:hypothetical protein